MSEKVLVAMSGGVDSSVAAALLLEAGYNVIGVTMQLWDYSRNEASCNPNEKFDTCCSLDDVADARMVAHRLGIPFYVFDYQDDFQTNVVDYFTSEYLKGRTPNPCVACNTFLKFDHLLDRAARLGCSKIATGHYARILPSKNPGEYRLLKGIDKSKDQSYFLHTMTSDKLAKTLFPVGGMTKPEVRTAAEKYGLVNARKKESMEICFIPNNDYAAFISKHAGNEPVIKGEIRHENGQILGHHDGIHHFTIGQRRGLGIAAGEPLYVTRIDSETGTVYAGGVEFLYRQGFYFRDFHMIRKFDFTDSDLKVKIRYRAEPCPVTLGLNEGKVFSTFKEKQKSVTPGQIAVLYLNDEVVGGGFIDGVIL